ncbi:pyrroline-5-carboxylate reductase 2-like [Haliotis cracherodii]|uniref:pyrroline-5-carboxylate reductase 2-like n=1 Tax=Haliotis cracherodii TaxID=6455 RepID=UPI0039ED4A92
MSGIDEVKSAGNVPTDIMVGFIGAGRMAQALASGFIASGLVRAGNIRASDPDPKSLNCIKELGVNVTRDNKEIVTRSSLVVIAVKPQVVEPVLQEVFSAVSSNNLFMSIASGISISTIEQNLPKGTRVLRVMPNTPSLVRAGAAVVSRGSAVEEGDTSLVTSLMNSVGLCEESQEMLLDVVTGVSGSGPAYAFAAIEALSDGGVKMGLPRDLAMKLAAQTMLGAAKMVLESGKHPGQLKDEVCSPGGTTIAAMHKLEKAGFRGALIDAVEAATLRARELGQKK